MFAFPRGPVKEIARPINRGELSLITGPVQTFQHRVTLIQPIPMLDVHPVNKNNEVRVAAAQIYNGRLVILMEMLQLLIVPLVSSVMAVLS